MIEFAIFLTKVVEVFGLATAAWAVWFLLSRA